MFEAPEPGPGNKLSCTQRLEWKGSSMSIDVPELIIRAVLVYAFVFLLLRIVGRKHVGELAPFDLVVLLILSDSVQNALIVADQGEIRHPRE